MTDICILCKANPQRNCDCRAPKPAPPKPAPKLVGKNLADREWAELERRWDLNIQRELGELEFTGSWDIYYTDMDKKDTPRCVVRSDGMMIFATTDKWGVSLATKARKNRRHLAPSGFFPTVKEAMEWVDRNIVENPKPVIIDFYNL